MQIIIFMMIFLKLSIRFHKGFTTYYIYFELQLVQFQMNNFSYKPCFRYFLILTQKYFING